MKIAAPGTLASPLHLIVGLGLASAVLYALGFRAPYPLSNGLAHPLASWATLAGFSWRVGLLLPCVYALLIGYYVLALRLAVQIEAQRARTALVVIVGGWLLTSVVLLGAYPGESLDIFDYLFRGRLQVILGVSPLATPPAPFASQLFYPYVNWTASVDTYGPLWEYASGGIAALVGAVSCNCPASLAHYILGYRLLAIGLVGLCGALIYAMTWRRSPHLAVAALLGWLWNPLLLTAAAIGAHNDMLMLLFILAAVLLFQRQHWLPGLLALALAAHVKLTALLLLPVLGLWMVRQRGWWRAIRISSGACVLALVLSWILYAPLGGWATLPRMLGERVRLIANSPAFVAYWMLQTYAGWSEVAAWRATTQGATLLFFGIAGVLLLRFWRATGAQAEPDDIVLWQASIAVTMAFLIVGSFWFWHWYVLWALALAALLPNSRFTRIVLPVCCLGAVWLTIAIDFLLRRWRPSTIITPIHELNALTWIVLAVGVAILPLLWRASRRHGCAWWWWRAPRWSRGSAPLRDRPIEEGQPIVEERGGLLGPRTRQGNGPGRCGGGRGPAGTSRRTSARAGWRADAIANHGRSNSRPRRGQSRRGAALGGRRWAGRLWSRGQDSRRHWRPRAGPGGTTGGAGVGDGGGRAAGGAA